MVCKHRISGRKEKIWLPYEYQGRDRGLKPHPYCVECGLIKNISSDRPHDIGYFMNVIGELGKHYEIAQVQKRLIVQEMIKHTMNDKFGIDRQQQEKLFIEITTRILNKPARCISEFL